MEVNKLHNALTAWTDALGSNSIELHESQDTNSNMLPSSVQLKPVSIEEIQTCLAIANEFGVSVYPLSTGLNWGYGSRNPASSESVVVDLSKLNQIVDYDNTLGIVTLEPGVSQTQLNSFLQQQGGDFWMDVTGSSPNCSVLGNSLERGFGHSPYSDHAAHLLELEVILANGNCIRTSMGQFAPTQSNTQYAAGIGPGLLPLFLQSNLGLITKATIQLMPRPEYFQAMYFSIEKNNQLANLIDVLRPLRLNGTIQSALHLGNGYRVLSSIQQYPWEAMNGSTPLSPEVLAQFGRQWDFGAWNGAAGLYGTRKQVAETKRIMKRALKGHVKRIRFMDDSQLEFTKTLKTPYKWLTGLNLPELLKIIEPVHGMMKGIPSDRVIASTYWRKRMPIPGSMDPDRDGCGLIWCAHLAPTKGVCAQEMADLVADKVQSHGFEPGMTITMINERTLDNVISISYDKDIQGEHERAMKCYHELANALIRKGHYPYRLGVQAMNLLSEYRHPSYQATLESIKHALDPNHILSPGRYI